jgi:hypothetical protein
MYVPPQDADSIDDVDLIGAVLGEPRHYFGLHEWGSRGTLENWQGRYDCVFYEIRKLVALLLQGNPNVLSLLWLRPEHYLSVDSSGRQLIGSRNLFVGKHVCDAFAGYAHAQLEKMETRDAAGLRQYLAVTAELKHRGAHPNHKGEQFPQPARDDGESRDAAHWTTERLLAAFAHFHKKGENIGYMGEKRKRLILKHGFDRKNAAHLVRLLRMCKDFLSTGELTVYRPDATELLEIKTGSSGGWTIERIKAHAAELFEECLVARRKSRLPEGPNRAGAEKLLVEILREHVLSARTP